MRLSARAAVAPSQAVTNPGERPAIRSCMWIVVEFLKASSRKRVVVEPRTFNRERRRSRRDSRRDGTEFRRGDGDCGETRRSGAVPGFLEMEQR